MSAVKIGNFDFPINCNTLHYLLVAAELLKSDLALRNYFISCCVFTLLTVSQIPIVPEIKNVITTRQLL